MSPVMKSFLSSNFEALEFFILNFTQVDPSWPLLGVRPGVDLSICLLPTRVVCVLSQSSGEPILAFIGCKTGGKPIR